MRDFKRYTSQKITEAINKNSQESRKSWMLWIFNKAGEKNRRNTKYQFWRQDNQPKELYSDLNSFSQQKLDYIHNNPVAAGIVESPEHYLYSSARNYAGNTGLIDVEPLD